MGGRYARQELLKGWDQKRLASATIAIAGSGSLAFLCGLMATAMGFGRLVLLGARPLRAVNLAMDGAWPQLYQRVNPKVRVYSSETRLSLGLARRLPALDGLIVASNELETRYTGEKIAREAKIPVIAGATAGRVGVWGTAAIDRIAIRICAHQESPLLSQIVAGLLVEEMRKALLPLAGEAGVASRNNGVCLPQPPASAFYQRRKRHGLPNHLAVVGAGALGTWFGLALGLLGKPASLNLYDDDEVSETNLNRQILFYEAVGKYKATALAARLQGLFPHLNTCGYAAKAETHLAEHLTRNPVLVACPDNFAARAFLNTLARKYSRVLISGGTSATGGSCLMYEPGGTACLSCRLRIDSLAGEEPQSCARQVQGSVVTSNAIVGALMAWMLHERLASGRAQAGMWEYDGRIQNTRLSLRPPWPACRCHLAG